MEQILVSYSVKAVELLGNTTNNTKIETLLA